jgi:RecB family exonuclease
MKVIRGAPGSGKTALVFREFKAALLTEGPEPRIVVPTATLVRHFQHELARDGVVCRPHSVISLNRFVRERAADVTPRLTVPGELLRALVRDALPAATTPGMVSTVVDTIELFENAGCTPEKLARVRKAGPHAKDFEKVWRAAGEAVRQRGYLMRSDLIRAATESKKPARVWLDGFQSLSPLECEFVQLLARVCEVTMTLNDSPATDEIRKFALQLRAEDRLLAGASRRPQTVLVEARTMEREADEIARRILALHDRGAPFREIGVALREAGMYLPLLRGTFERFGIPARFYFSSLLRKHPVAIFLGGLISGALNHWEFEPAIEALRAHPGWGASADFDRFDFAVRKAMPGKGAPELLSLCEADWLREKIAVCLQTDSWKDMQRTPGAWRRQFESLAVSLYRPGKLDPTPDYAGIEAARSHTAALRAWLSAIESVTAFWNPSDQLVTLEEFWRIAQDAIDGAVYRAPDDRANVVHVMSVWEARQWDVANLFVCGMTDRDFPRQQPQNLLFSDSEIDRLRAAGIPLRKASDQEREEQWLFDSLRTRATSSLFLCYPRHDVAGKSAQCSRWLAECSQASEAARSCSPVPRFPAEIPSLAGHVNSPGLHTEMARLHEKISLTALEELAQCRFKFFSGRTLHLKGAPERAAERLTPRVMGSIMHAALERWLADRGQDFVEVFESTFDEVCRTEHLPQGYKLEVERIQCREIARRVSANDLWDPRSSEAEVELTLEFPRGITVSGRVDRIDTFDRDKFGNDCVIVDYKSSKTASVQKLVASQTRLQGPLYALAARERLNLNPVAMIYWAVREDERYGWGKIPGTDLEFQPIPENWAEDARDRTIERLSGFLAGDVKAHPVETEQCRWCDFRNACRVEQAALVVIEGARGA